jgi:hypothetical protein
MFPDLLQWLSFPLSFSKFLKVWRSIHTYFTNQMKFHPFCTTGKMILLAYLISRNGVCKVSNSSFWALRLPVLLPYCHRFQRFMWFLWCIDPCCSSFHGIKTWNKTGKNQFMFGSTELCPSTLCSFSLRKDKSGNHQDAPIEPASLKQN